MKKYLIKHLSRHIAGRLLLLFIAIVSLIFEFAGMFVYYTAKPLVILAYILRGQYYTAKKEASDWTIYVRDLRDF